MTVVGIHVGIDHGSEAFFGEEHDEIQDVVNNWWYANMIRNEIACLAYHFYSGVMEACAGCG